MKSRRMALQTVLCSILIFSLVLTATVAVSPLAAHITNGWLAGDSGISDDGRVGSFTSAGEPIAEIVGETREVDSAILPGANITMYYDYEPIASILSDEDGKYTLSVPHLGTYNVTASMAGFRAESRSISVTEEATYTLDFVADHGLIPKAPGDYYVDACIDLWRFGEPPYQLSKSRVLAVINARNYPKATDPVYRPESIMADQETENVLTSVSEDHEILTFAENTDLLDDLEPGDVLVMGITDHTPGGLLRRVTAVTQNEEEVIVETEFATMEDVFEAGTVEVTGTITAADAQAAAAGVEGLTVRHGHEDEGFIIAWEDMEVVAGFTTTGQLEFQVDPVVNVELHYYFGFIPGLQRLELTVETEELIELRVEGEIAEDFKKPIKLLPTIVKPIPAPIPFVIEFTPMLVIEASVSGELEVGVVYEGERRAGLAYERRYGWRHISEEDSEFYPHGELEFEANLRVSAGPEVAVKVAGIVGPKGGIFGYLELEAAYNEELWWRLYGGLWAELGIVAEIFGWGIGYGPVEVMDCWWLLAGDDAIYVPNHFSTVQGAVNAARSPDTIVVRAGTYNENVNVHKSDLTIRSAQGPGVTTIQAANSNDHVFYLDRVGGVTISGFTITGATGQYKSGIALDEAHSNSIVNNVISENYAGFGLLLSYNNIIHGNTFRNNAVGGAISEDPGHAGGCAVAESVYSAQVTATPDEDLDSLRTWRDKELNATYVDAFYRYSPEVTRILMSEPRLLIQSAKLISKYTPGVRYVLGQGGEDLEITDEGVQDMVAFLRSLRGAVTERQHSIGVTRSESLTTLLAEFEKEVRASEGKVFSEAFRDSVYSAGNEHVIDLSASATASARNRIYFNNFRDNQANTERHDANIAWNSAHRIYYAYKGNTFSGYLGNYWDDHIGDDADGDGIIDEPYVMDGANIDSYPLAEPFQNYTVYASASEQLLSEPSASYSGNLQREAASHTVELAAEGDPGAEPVRGLPAAVVPGQTFGVTVTFASPHDEFNAIGLTDVAPPDWNARVDKTWSTLSALVAHTPAPEEAVYIWGGPYDVGVEFTLVYEVVVPIDAEEGTYSFPGGWLEYYVGEEGPFTTGITGHTQIDVVEMATTGFTGEVSCDILPEVRITLYQNDVWLGETVSDEGGYYILPIPEAGDYEVVASKEGFRPETKVITVDEPMTTVDFVGAHGLIPNDPDVFYMLDCIILWQYPEPPCALDIWRIMDVIIAWQYPILED